MTQAINLANFANNLDSSGGLNPTALNAAVPFSRGGTNATTSAGAATNLGPDMQTVLFPIIYPVGSIYMNASVNTNPATLFGFGTWVSLGDGRVLMGFKSGDPLFGTAGNTGGSQDAVVVSHSHTNTLTDTGHQHITANTPVTSGINPFGWSSTTIHGGAFAGVYDNVANLTSSQTTGVTVTVNSSGVSGTNANLVPYLVVYMWRRTA